MSFDVKLAFFETLKIAKILNYWGRNGEINLAVLICQSSFNNNKKESLLAHTLTHTHTYNKSPKSIIKAEETVQRDGVCSAGVTIYQSGPALPQEVLERVQ